MGVARFDGFSRAEVIRSLLDALDESRLDVTSVLSGAQLKRMVAQKLPACHGLDDSQFGI